jgi:glycosyltransferase involved in cell wall biosynthesis
VLKKLHLCLVIGSSYPPYPHGGVGSFAVDLAEGIVKRGHKVTCISYFPTGGVDSNGPRFEKINGVNIVRIPLPNRRRLPRINAVREKYKLAKLIRTLHQQDPFTLIEAEDGGGRLALGRLPDIPKIVRLHATTIYNDYVLHRKPSRLNHLFEYIWIRRANFIIAVSDYVGKITLQLTHLQKKKKYTIIHYAIDTDFYKPMPEIQGETGLIVFTGVVAPRKGVEELIRAMNIVFSQIPDSKLWIIGDDKYKVNGEPFSKQIIQSLEAPFKNRVVFLGNKPREELPSFLQKAEVCCFPSHVETFGIGIIEAMAMEKPVIFMRDGPGPEVIEDNISGLLCDTWSPEDIAEKILFLIRNTEKARNLGKNGRKRVLDNFEKESWIERNLDYYQKCLNEFREKRIS